MLFRGTRAVRAKSYRSTLKTFMDVTIGGEATPRRITFELFGKQCPVAVENFVKLCTGENVLPHVAAREGIAQQGFSETLLPQLTYRGSSFHRVSKGFVIQGGDVVSADGTNQLSIYGETFDAPDEVERSVFDRPFLVGTAVSAPHLNGSQFFIVTSPNGASHLNKTCICFGRVTGGQEVVRDIEALHVRSDGQPTVPVKIVDCGEL